MQSVSIVIPVKNEQAIIRDALLALQAYRQQGHELILVDGGSTDETKSLAVNLYDRLLECRPGRARQMNAGAQQARGEILLFLHADSRLPENAINIIIKRFDRENSKVWGRFDVRLSGSHPLFSLIAFFMNLRSCLTGIATGDQAMFVQRSAFIKLAGFPDMPLMEDIQLSRNLLALSRPICVREKVTSSSRRWEKKGIVRTILLMWYLRLAYFLGKSPDELSRIYTR